MCHYNSGIYDGDGYFLDVQPLLLKDQDSRSELLIKCWQSRGLGRQPGSRVQTRAMKNSRVKTHFEHSELACAYLLPCILGFSCMCLPDSPTVTAGYLLPCVVGDVETGFGCLLTDWSWFLLCRITVDSRQFRK